MVAMVSVLVALFSLYDTYKKAQSASMELLKSASALEYQEMKNEELSAEIERLKNLLTLGNIPQTTPPKSDK